MRLLRPRLGMVSLMLVMASSGAAMLCAQPHAAAGTHPKAVAPVPQHPPATGRNPAQGAKNQEHLAEWMSHHQNLPPSQQQHALETEPGFRELPAQTQQRMRDRLTQLNNMPAQQRSRILERNEAMEHLAPEQRQQVRGAMSQLGSLPEDRRKAVARAFRDLRSMPEEQRLQYLNSPAFHGQFNDQERGTITNLMTVEPLLPPPHRAETPQQ